MKKTKNRKKIIVFLGITLLVVAVILLTIFIWKNSNRKLLKIDNEIVNEDEYNFYAVRYLKSLSITDGVLLDGKYSGNRTYGEFYKEDVCDLIINNKILCQCADKYGIKLSKEDKENIEKQVDNIIDIIGEEALDDYNIDNKLISKVYTEEYKASKLKETIMESIDIDEDVNYVHYYNLLFPTVEIDELGYVVTDANGDVSYISESEKQSQYDKASEALTDIVEGTDVKIVANSYGIEASSIDMYNTENGMFEETYKALSKLKEGEVSNVYETQYGYNVSVLITLDDEEYDKIMMDYDNDVTKESEWDKIKNDLISEYKLGKIDVFHKNYDDLDLKNLYK